MRNINIKKIYSWKLYFWIWVVLSILGAGYTNLNDGHPFLWSLDCSKKGFEFISVCLSGDFFYILGISFVGFIPGFIISFMVKIFRRRTLNWSLVFMIALVFQILVIYGALNQ
jgi:hypothetical protein